MKRRFPAFQKFLSAKVVSLETPVTNIVRTGRTRNLVTRGPRGQGAPAVTCQDSARVLAALLGGDTPQTANDLLEWLLKSKPGALKEEPPPIQGLAVDWWQRPFPDAVAQIIEARFLNPKFSFTRGLVVVHRTFMSAEINWNEGNKQFGVITYHSVGAPPRMTSGRKQLTASFDGYTLMMVADWLAEREGTDG